MLSEPHLSANGTRALVGASVEVVVEEKTDITDLESIVTHQSMLQPLQPTKYHQKMTVCREGGGGGGRILFD